VDAKRIANGPAQKINSEVTTLLPGAATRARCSILSNGKLRLISRSGGQPPRSPLESSWRPNSREGKVTIHAGKLWDGHGPDVLSDVDIV